VLVVQICLHITLSFEPFEVTGFIGAVFKSCRGRLFMLFDRMITFFVYLNGSYPMIAFVEADIENGPVRQWKLREII